MDETQRKLLIQNLKIQTTELLFKATSQNFSHDQFIESCEDASPTICLIKTSRDRVFGACTDICWTDNGKEVRFKGNSFVFTFCNNKLEIFSYNGTSLHSSETWHSKFAIFAIAGGPWVRVN